MADVIPGPRRIWRDEVRNWIAAHPYWTLTLVVVLALGPFLDKPFNMDDPLFVWTARQIQAHPLDPFGFEVNWYGTPLPMSQVTRNPPLASYYMALAAAVLGWSERALHAAFLLPAIAVVLGTYRLAARACDRPLLAALAAALSPVFLVSSTSVMCDVLMLACWLWAVVLWLEGLEQKSWARLAAAAGLMTLAALTKYFGAALVPLLAACGLIKERRPGWWAALLLVPVAGLLGWQWFAQSSYQQAVVFDAVSYARNTSGFFAGTRLATILIGLSFAGGCLAVVVFLAPWLWRGRDLLALTIGSVLLVAGVFAEGTLLKMYYWMQGGERLGMEAQILVWTAGGVSVLALAVADVWQRRDAMAWLLALWVAGTFIFTAVFNWTINGRSLLPMAPAVGILIARRLQARAAAAATAPLPGPRGVWAALAAGAVLGWMVARADYLLAATVRKSAEATWNRFGGPGRKLWFQGQWGFQYYMKQLGALEEDQRNPALQPGDFLAVPLYNTNLKPPPGRGQEIHIDGPRWLAAMNIDVAASFYFSEGGPLPFAFGDVPRDFVMIYRWK